MCGEVTGTGDQWILVTVDVAVRGGTMTGGPCSVFTSMEQRNFLSRC